MVSFVKFNFASKHFFYFKNSSFSLKTKVFFNNNLTFFIPHNSSFMSLLILLVTLNSVQLNLKCRPPVFPASLSFFFFNTFEIFLN